MRNSTSMTRKRTRSSSPKILSYFGPSYNEGEPGAHLWIVVIQIRKETVTPSNNTLTHTSCVPSSRVKDYSHLLLCTPYVKLRTPDPHILYTHNRGQSCLWKLWWAQLCVTIVDPCSRFISVLHCAKCVYVFNQVWISLMLQVDLWMLFSWEESL